MGTVVVTARYVISGYCCVAKIKECFVNVSLDSASRCTNIYCFDFIQIPVLSTTEFVQGNVHRWGIAWSFIESERSKVS